MKLFCFVILFLTISTSSVVGQKQLSEEELVMFQNRAIDYVVLFEDYIKNIGQSNSSESKNAYILAALDLFEEKATMEVSYLNKDKKISISKKTIQNYLYNLARNSLKYEVVVIDFEATKIENLKKQNKNGVIYYEGNYSYTQRFYAEKKSITSSDIENRKFVIGDVTSKKGKIILKQVTTVIGDQWILKLSDISVDETKPLDP
jgi:hypothetical protein